MPLPVHDMQFCLAKIIRTISILSDSILILTTHLWREILVDVEAAVPLDHGGAELLPLERRLRQRLRVGGARPPLPPASPAAAAATAVLRRR